MPELIQFSDFFKGGSPQDVLNQFKDFMDKLGNIVTSEMATIKKQLGSIQVPTTLTGANIKAQGSQTSDIEKSKTKIKELTALEKEHQKLMLEYQSLSAKYAASTSEMTRRNAEYRDSIRRANEETKRNAQLSNMPIGSIERLNAEMNKNIMLRRRMAVYDAETAREFQRLTVLINKQEAALKSYDAQIGRYTRNVGNYKSALNGAGASLKNLALQFVSFYAAINIGKDIFRITKELNSLSFSFKTLIKDSGELANTQAFLADISKRFGLNILSTSQAYLRFQASIQATNFDMREAKKIFESVSKAGAVLGLSAQRIDLAFLAIEQMISKGTVSAEELRRQLGDNIPGAMQIMASALGVTIPKLMKMIKANEVLATEALPKFARELEKAYGIEKVKRVDNLQASIGRLQTAWINLVAAINGAEVSQGVINFITKLTELFNFKAYDQGVMEVYAEKIKLIGDRLRDIQDTPLFTRMLMDELQATTKMIDDLGMKIVEYKHKYGDNMQAVVAFGGYKGLKDMTTQYEALKKVRTELEKWLKNPLRVRNIISDVDNEVLLGFLQEIEDRIKAIDELIKASRDKNEILNYEKEKESLQALQAYYENLNFDTTNIKELQERHEQLVKAMNAAKVLGWSPERQEDIKNETIKVGELLKAYENLFGILAKPEMEILDIPKAEFRRYSDDWVQSVNSINANLSKAQEEFDNAETEKERKRLSKRIAILEQELKEAMGKSGLADGILLKIGIPPEQLEMVKASLMELQRASFDLFSSLIDYQTELAQADLKRHEEAVKALESRIDKEKELKDEGKANDFDRLVDQLATEQKLRDDAQKKYEKYQKRQAQLKFVETQANLGLAVAEAFAAGAGEGPAGWIMAIAAAAAMIAAFASMKAQIASIGNQNQYAEGTEYVNGPGTEKSDSVHARLSKGERVVPANINRRLHGIDNEKLPEMFDIWKMNLKYVQGNTKTDSFGELVSEMQKNRGVSEQMLSTLKENETTAVNLGDGRVMIIRGKYNTQIVTLR